MGDYCTTADIHTRLTDLSTDYDTLIAELCTEASRAFDRETGRRFDKTTAVRYATGTGSRLLVDLPGELAAITLVRVRSTPTGSWRTVPLTPAEGNRLGDIVLCPEGRDTSEPASYLRLLDTPAGSDRVWPMSDASVEITGDWGFAAVPGDVKDATIELVVAMLRDRGVSVGGAQGTQDMSFDARPRTYPDITYRVFQQRRQILVA